MSAGLVSQHQQSSFATPINGAAGDATVVLGNDNATVGSYNAHDADATIHLQSSSAAVFAATPAGTLGRKWLTNDTGAVYQYYDTGSVWVEVNYLRNTGGTITGNLSVTGTITGTSSSAVALTIGLNGATNPAFTVDASTALQVAGLKVTGAVTGGTVAVVVTDSGSNANLTVNAKGSGTIGIGSVSTGRVTITPVTTITGLLTLTAGITGPLSLTGITTVTAAVGTAPQFTVGATAFPYAFGSNGANAAVVATAVGTRLGLLTAGTSTVNRLFGQKATGTVASPGATASGDSLLQIEGRGYDTTVGWDVGGGAVVVNLLANQNWTNTAHGTRIEFSTTPNGSVSAAIVLTIGNDGTVTHTGPIVGGSATDITINTNKFTVAASTGNTVVAGTLGVTGAATFTTTIKTQSVTAVQMDTGGAGIVVANNASGTITLPIYCTITVSETAVNGSTAVFVVTNSVISILYQTGGDYTVTAGTGAKTNVTYAAGVLSIQNMIGAQATYRVSTVGRGP